MHRRAARLEQELREQRRLTWETWQDQAILTDALEHATDLLGQVVTGAAEVERERDALRAASGSTPPTPAECLTSEVCVEAELQAREDALRPDAGDE